jgi:Ras family protein T1
MTTLLEHKTTLAYLAYLGFESNSKGGTTDALKVTKKQHRGGKVRRTSKLERNVVLAFVIGDRGSGKVKSPVTLFNFRLR